MSVWVDFLSALGTEVTLVGPLHDQPHVPTMPTVYVDGGTHFRTGLTHFPTVSVGDGDSSRTGLDQMLPREKDFSDLAFVLRQLPPSIMSVTLLGFLGGRRDHELANFGEVHAFLSRRAPFTRVAFLARERVIAFARGGLSLDVRGTFSVFTLEPAPVRIEGACRYRLDGQTLAILGSLGLSNEGHGVVRLTADRPCFLLF